MGVAGLIYGPDTGHLSEYGGRDFGPRLVAFCVPSGFGEKIPILVMGKQRTTGGAAEEDVGCVRNPPTFICIQVLPRAGANAKRRGALRCHTL